MKYLSKCCFLVRFQLGRPKILKSSFRLGKCDKLSFGCHGPRKSACLPSLHLLWGTVSLSFLGPFHFSVSKKPSSEEDPFWEASWSHTEILRFSLAASSRCLSIDMTHEKQESPNHRCRYHPEPASSTSTAGIWTSPWERVALCAHGHAQEHLCATKLICVKVTDQIAAKGLEFNQLLTQTK